LFSFVKIQKVWNMLTVEAGDLTGNGGKATTSSFPTYLVLLAFSWFPVNFGKDLAQAKLRASTDRQDAQYPGMLHVSAASPV